jgi:hypothetical protein
MESSVWRMFSRQNIPNKRLTCKILWIKELAGKVGETLCRIGNCRPETESKFKQKLRELVEFRSLGSSCAVAIIH